MADTRIGGIYVEVRGDWSKFTSDMRKVRAEAKAQGVEISNALNNAISPTQAARSITLLGSNLQQLANIAKTPAASFRTTSQSIADNLGMMARQAGLSSHQFAELNEKILRVSAARNAEQSLLGIARAAGLTKRETQQLAMQMGFSNAQARKMASGLDYTRSAGSKLQRSLNSLQRTLVNAFGVLVVYQVSRLGAAVVKTADNYTLFRNQLKLVTDSSEELLYVQSELQKIAADTHVAFEPTLTTYTRMARAVAHLNFSQDDLLDVTRALNEAVLISAARSQEAGNAMIQFSQGLQSGRLGGEELRAVMEQLPEIAKQIAKGMGIPWEKFREEARKGKLTAEDMIRALLKQSDELHNMVTGLAVTMGQAWTTIGVNFGAVVDDMNREIMGTDSLAESMMIFAGWLREFHESGAATEWAHAMKAAAEGLGDVLSIITDRFHNFANFAAILAAVKEGELSFWEAATMGPKEADAWLNRYNEAMKTTVSSHGVYTGQLKASHVVITNDLIPAHEGLVQISNDLMAAHEDVGKKGVEAFEKTEEAAKNAKPKIEDVKDESENLKKTWGELNREIADTGETYDVMLPAFLRGEDELTKAIIDTTEIADQSWKNHKDAVVILQEDMVNDLGRIFDGYINDILTGEIDSIEDLFEGLFGSILDMFSRLLSQMAANSLIDAIFGSGASGGPTLGDLLGGGGLLGDLLGGGEGGGLLEGISTATGLGGLGAKIAGWLGIGASPSLPVGVAAPTVPAAGGALLPGGAVPAEGGLLGGLSMGGLFAGGVAALGIGLWAKSVFGSDKPTTTEMWNQLGLRPEDFAQYAGDSFVEAVDPAWGGLTHYMATAAGEAVSTWDQAREGIGSITTRIYNETTGAWEELRYTTGATFAMLHGDVVSEMDAMVMEANYGIDGLAAHLITASETALSTGDKIRNEFEEMGLSGGELKKAMDLAQRAMDSASGEADDLERYLRDLGYTADDIAGAIDTMNGRFDSLGDVLGAVGTEIGNLNANEMPTFLSDIGAIAGAVEDASERIRTAEDLIDQGGPVIPGAPPPPAPPPGGGTTIGSAGTSAINVYVMVDGKELANSKKFSKAIWAIADRNRVTAFQRGFPHKPLAYG